MADSTEPKSATSKPATPASITTGEAALEALRHAAQDLLFPSETDAPIEPFFWPLPSREAPSVELIALQVKAEPATVKKQGLTALFKPVVTDAEWHSETEKAEVKRFQNLLNVAKTSLSEAKVFRVGAVAIDIYVVGRVADGYAGFKTKVVET